MSTDRTILQLPRYRLQAGGAAMVPLLPETGATTT